MSRTNYDGEYYKKYADARQLLPDTMRVWGDAAAKFTPAGVIRQVVDVGAGTGRFSPLLSTAFGADVVGVEPSEQMRGNAESANRNPRIRFVAGRAEALPLPDGSCDVGWLSMVLHHVPDRAACARELFRVIRPGGRVLCRHAYGDRLRITGIPLYHYFPRALEIDEARQPTTKEVVTLFRQAGFTFLTLEPIRQVLEPNLTAFAARLRKGSISTLETLTPAEMAEGLARIDADARAPGGDQPVTEIIDLLVFEKPAVPA